MHPLNDTFKPRVRPITWVVTWITDSQITGLTLPGILDDPGWVSGRPISLRCDDHPLSPSRQHRIESDDANCYAETARVYRVYGQCGRRFNWKKCVIGIEANEARCRELVEGSLAMVTALAPLIGYDAAAQIATKRLQPARAFDSWRSSKKCCPKIINSTAI